MTGSDAAGEARDARAVANEILYEAWRQGLTLTVMQLVKLVYLAQGWSLALYDRRMFMHDVQAWQYGPVVPVVYKAFSRFGSRPIDEAARDKASGLEYGDIFDEREKSLIKRIVAAYGPKHAYDLSSMMHKPGTPWSTTKDTEGLHKEIPVDRMRTFFRLLRNNPNAGA